MVGITTVKKIPQLKTFCALAWLSIRCPLARFWSLVWIVHLRRDNIEEIGWEIKVTYITLFVSNLQIMKLNLERGLLIISFIRLRYLHNSYCKCVQPMIYTNQLNSSFFISLCIAILSKFLFLKNNDIKTLPFETTVHIQHPLLNGLQRKDKRLINFV